MVSRALKVISKAVISKNLKHLLLEKPGKSIIIRPGDYIIMDDLDLPVFDVMDIHGMLRILIFYEGELPNTRFVEIEKTNPTKGKVSVLGSIQNPIVAVLRLNGYEVFNSYVKKSNLVILTEPVVQKLDFDEKVLIAPIDSLGLSSYQQLNRTLEEANIGITYNLNKPIIEGGDFTVEINFFRRKIFVKTLPYAYFLKITNGLTLGTINEKGPIVALSEKKKVFVTSSINLFYPYDLIYGKGENSLFLLDIIEKNELSELKKKSPEKKRKIKSVTITDKNEMRLDLGNIEPQLVFQKTIELLTKLGAIILKKNDTTKTAELRFLDILGEINIRIAISGKNLLIRCLNCSEDRLRNFRAITSFLESFIRDVAQDQINKEKIRLLIRALSIFYRKLLIAKDMLELDINAGEIQNELCEAYSAISSISFLEVVAEEIADYCRGGRGNIDPLKPYPEKVKQKLLSKIDEWYERATVLSEKNI